MFHRHSLSAVALAARFRRARFGRLAGALLAVGLPLMSFHAAPEDIEIFTSNESSLVGKPNVLIVLDNSANWARQSQQWPGGLAQGQSEARAIQKVVNSLDLESVSVGLMLYSTQGNANTNEGGYLRHHIRPLTASNRSTLSNHLDVIFNNINASVEKRSQGNGYGTLMWDVYNYFGGLNQSQEGSGTPASRADVAAYSSQYSRFRSPLSSATSCGRNIVIFIGNNVQSGPSKDATNAVTALQNAGGDTTDLPFADYRVEQRPTDVSRGQSTSCYSSVAACTSAENNAECAEQGFSSCFCDASTEAPCLLKRFNVIGTQSTTAVISDTTTTSGVPIYTGENRLTCINRNQEPAYACPAASVSSTQNSPQPGQTTTVTTSWNSCSYVDIGNSGCNGQRRNLEPRGVQSRRTVVTQRIIGSSSTLGPAASCSSTPTSCDTSNYADCSNGNLTSCTCNGASFTTTGCPTSATANYEVIGRTVTSEATPTGTFSSPSGGPWVADEWAKFLRQTGAPLPGAPDGRAPISTYTVDVFNAQQNADFSALLFNMARVGGGKYYQARNEDQITAALTQIFAEIQAVNSAFSSASLPVNATNRAQSENQVYIGLFRPDRTKNPRWFGNLKRYQLVLDNGIDVELGDRNGRPAVNRQTGFLDECAVSFWTTDSGNYWSQVIADDPAAVGNCPSALSPHSDLPDGPFVEKGAAAQILRRGNSATGVPDANGNFAVRRNMLTRSGNALVPLSTVDSAVLDNTVKSYLMGADVGRNPIDEDVDGVLNETRASIHGDVIHSRPQTVNYGGSTGVVIYYGANDGAYRAVRGETGEEIWSFVATEHFSQMNRLLNNSPTVDLSGGLNGKPYFFDGSTGLFQAANNSDVLIYPSQRRGGRRVYGFDVGAPLSNPGFMWSVGCDRFTTDAGCSTGFADIGQTWSRPTAAIVKGFSESTPLVAFGGGYDVCEDQNRSDPDCAGTKGAGIYVVNGRTGGLLRHFNLKTIDPLARGVSADLATLDRNGDGSTDYLYAASMDGGIYRVDFVDAANAFLPLPPDQWRITKVAQTRTTPTRKSGRKFLYSPSILQSGNEVYIAIGSGDREHPLESHYPTTEGIVNRFYVIRDDLRDVDSSSILNLDDPSVVLDYTVDQGCDAETFITPGSNRRGWFVDLTERGAGEQVVTSPVIVAGQVFFSTNRPTPPDPNTCSNSLGEARGYILNLLNGSGAVGVAGACGGDRSAEFIGGGLPPSPVVARVPIVNQDGDTVIKTVLIGAADKDGSDSSIIGAQQVEPDIDTTRRPISWRRLLDTD